MGSLEELELWMKKEAIPGTLLSGLQQGHADTRPLSGQVTLLALGEHPGGR